jgi:hypothetical protein
MPVSPLPDVVYIGNMRSGSTFVRSFLEVHPQIRWTRRAWYFQLGDSDAERCATYRAFFDTPPPDGGCHVDMYESLFLGQYFRTSPPRDFSYQDTPEWDRSWAAAPDYDLARGPMAVAPNEVARRIAACLPDGRVLIVLREQAGWMRSMYRHYLPALPRGRRHLDDFLTTLDGQAAWRALRYDKAIEPYLDAFGAHAVHLVLFEELTQDPQGALDRLCEFLGLPPVDFPAGAGERNEGMDPAHARQLRYGRPGALLRRWTQRRRALEGPPDFMTKAEIARIRAASVEGNRVLESRLDIDLGAHGYAV